jgi:hypothetical protein
VQACRDFLWGACSRSRSSCGASSGRCHLLRRLRHAAVASQTCGCISGCARSGFIADRFCIRRVRTGLETSRLVYSRNPFRAASSLSPRRLGTQVRFSLSSSSHTTRLVIQHASTLLLPGSVSQTPALLLAPYGFCSFCLSLCAFLS